MVQSPRHCKPPSVSDVRKGVTRSLETTTGGTVRSNPAICRYTTLLGLLALLSCSPSATDVNEGAVAFTPPDRYRTLWTGVQSCSGESGGFGRLRWFVSSELRGGTSILGQWLPPHNITIKAGYERHDDVVRHEMLHDLLQGDRFHRDRAWIRCRIPTGVG
jgi:hypothetical protein